jgi:hypothetical protein
VWRHEYVITSLLEISVSKNKTRRPPSAGGTLDRTSFAATRSVCLEGALARPCTILVVISTPHHNISQTSWRVVVYITSLSSINSPPTRILKTFLQIYRKYSRHYTPLRREVIHKAHSLSRLHSRVEMPIHCPSISRPVITVTVVTILW